MTTMTETMNTRVRMRHRCAVDEGTETPEEFEVDDKDKLRRPEGDDADE